MTQLDTIVALSTASGQGAIAVVRLSGAEAIRIVDGHLDRDLISAAAHTATHGWIRDTGGEAVDEVVVTVFRGPNSYTGEDVVEVSCHGSEYIVRRLLELFADAGARPADRGEFTMRAYLNGKMDLSQAESVADVIAAQSGAAHELALKQLRGGVSSEIARLRKELIDFASLLELELDFAEEDVEFADREELTALVKKIRTVVQSLITSFSLGNAIRHGVSTVIAGRPNAGKSTLLNALLQDERAIVSEIAGTTRDTIEEMLTIEGITFRLIDTAGLRDAQDQIEALGVERAMEKISQSAIVAYVFDVTQMQRDDVQADVARLRTSTPSARILAVANKMDLHPYAHKDDWTGEHLKETDVIPMSAKNQMNLQLLREKLVETIHVAGIDPALPVISNARHYQALRKVDENLQAVEEGFAQGITSDFIAMDLRQALHWLGEITGEVTTEDLLGNIFENFCIGK